MKKPKNGKIVPSIKKSFNDRHPFIVPVVTLGCLLVLSLTGFVLFGGQVVKPADSKVVNLYVDGKRRAVPTRADTVEEFLQRAGVQIDKNDLVEPAPGSLIESDGFSVNIYRAKQVTVIDEDGKKKIAKIADTSPELMAKKAGFDLYPEDKVGIVEPDISLREGVIGTQVVINRALPVKMNLYGKTYDIRTHAETVGDLLKDRNIKADNNSVLPSPETKLKENDIVFVTEPGKKIELLEEIIDQPIEYIDATDQLIGYSETREEGRSGKKVVVYEISPSGQKVPLQEIIVIEPVRKLVARGTKPDPSKLFNGSFEAALAQLRSCEGSYSSSTGNGYYGAYQFDIGTWNNYGGYPNASAAPPIIQDQKAWETYQRRGWQPWPSCSQKLGLQDVYR